MRKICARVASPITRTTISLRTGFSNIKRASGNRIWSRSLRAIWLKYRAVLIMYDQGNILLPIRKACLSNQSHVEEFRNNHPSIAASTAEPTTIQPIHQGILRREFRINTDGITPRNRTQTNSIGCQRLSASRGSVFRTFPIILRSNSIAYVCIKYSAAAFVRKSKLQTIFRTV